MARSIGGEVTHRALVSALVHVKEASRELKTAQAFIRESGGAGPITGEIQAQLDLLEQAENDIERAALDWIVRSA